MAYVYDGRGRLKQEVYPDGTTWTNLRNDAGLLTKITTPLRLLSKLKDVFNKLREFVKRARSGSAGAGVSRATMDEPSAPL